MKPNKKIVIIGLLLIISSDAFSAEIGGKIIAFNSAITGTAHTLSFAGYLIVNINPTTADLSGSCANDGVALKLDMKEFNIFMSQLLFAAAKDLYVQFQFSESEKIPGSPVCLVSSLLVNVI